jgi:hypothetical protein
MPSWGAVAWGVTASALLAMVATRLLFREHGACVLAAAATTAAAGPLLWDLILRHTGGKFLVDAPGIVFPISYEDTISGVFATAIGVVLLGLGPLRAATGRRVALGSLVCGAAALVVDIYLY